MRGKERIMLSTEQQEASGIKSIIKKTEDIKFPPQKNGWNKNKLAFRRIISKHQN